jgi:hypothetical protein
VIGWNGHLKERRILDSCFAERSGEAIDPRAAEHLADCLACRQRYAEIAGFLETTWAVAEAELDAAFSPEQLRAQQEQIARRIEQLAQGARVITFPGREARPGRLMPSTMSRAAPRWIASAAAAGLFVGIGLGVFLGPRAANQPTTVVAPSASAPVARPSDAPGGVLAERQDDTDSDDPGMILSGLLIERPQPEFVALDALTPQVREISYIIR